MKAEDCLPSVRPKDIVGAVQVADLIDAKEGELGAVHAHKEICEGHYVKELEPAV